MTLSGTPRDVAAISLQPAAVALAADPGESPDPRGGSDDKRPFEDCDDSESPEEDTDEPFAAGSSTSPPNNKNATTLPPLFAQRVGPPGEPSGRFRPPRG